MDKANGSKSSYRILLVKEILLTYIIIIKIYLTIINTRTNNAIPGKI